MSKWNWKYRKRWPSPARNYQLRYVTLWTYWKRLHSYFFIKIWDSYIRMSDRCLPAGVLSRGTFDRLWNAFRHSPGIYLLGKSKVYESSNKHVKDLTRSRHLRSIGPGFAFGNCRFKAPGLICFILLVRHFNAYTVLYRSILQEQSFTFSSPCLKMKDFYSRRSYTTETLLI